MNINSEALEKKKSNVVGRLITGIFIGVTVSSFFFLWGDVQSVKDVIVSIPIQYVALAVLFTLISYLLRFLKWQYFLKFININVSFGDSLNIFFIGLSMSITPGKIGELLKPYLLKNVSGTEFSKSAPAVFVDRLTDMLAMLFLVSVGINAFSFSYLSIIVVFTLLLTVVLILKSRNLSYKAINVLTSLKLFSKYKAGLESIYESAYDLLKNRLLLMATIIATIAWFMECVSFLILIKSLGLDLGILKTTFIFSFATIAGALSMLPGGLGVAEGSITGLLMYFDITKSTAVSLTILIRLVTLWLGVVIGVLIFLNKRKGYMKLK